MNMAKFGSYRNGVTCKCHGFAGDRKTVRAHADVTPANNQEPPTFHRDITKHGTPQSFTLKSDAQAVANHFPCRPNCDRPITPHPLPRCTPHVQMAAPLQTQQLFNSMDAAMTCFSTVYLFSPAEICCTVCNANDQVKHGNEVHTQPFISTNPAPIPRPIPRPKHSPRTDRFDCYSPVRLREEFWCEPP